MIARLRACLDPRSMPYERLVCQIAWCIRLVFVLTPAVACWTSTAFVPAWWGAVAGLGGALGGWLVRLLATWACGWLGGFLWADAYLEESYREALTGASVNSNLFPTCTLEGYNGFVRSRYAGDDANEKLFNVSKFVVWLPWERDGQPVYGIPPENTRAVRFHHAIVRPLLVRHGIPGYEMTP